MLQILNTVLFLIILNVFVIGILLIIRLFIKMKNERKLFNISFIILFLLASFFSVLYFPNSKPESIHKIAIIKKIKNDYLITISADRKLNLDANKLLQLSSEVQQEFKIPRNNGEIQYNEIKWNNENYKISFGSISIKNSKMKILLIDTANFKNSIHYWNGTYFLDQKN